MKVIWDPEKKLWLEKHRNISLDELSEYILRKEYLDILENPSRKDQMIFVVDYREYTHVVPFVVDTENNIVLKTAFPSRRFHRIYGGIRNEARQS